MRRVLCRLDGDYCILCAPGTDTASRQLLAADAQDAWRLMLGHAIQVKKSTIHPAELKELLDVLEIDVPAEAAVEATTAEDEHVEPEQKARRHSQKTSDPDLPPPASHQQSVVVSHPSACASDEFDETAVAATANHANPIVRVYNIHCPPPFAAMVGIFERDGLVVRPLPVARVRHGVFAGFVGSAVDRPGGRGGGRLLLVLLMRARFSRNPHI